MTLLLFLALQSGTCAETNIFPEFHLETARNYLLSLSEIVQAQVGTNVDALFTTARLQNQLGHSVEAERLACRALELSPKRTDLEVFLADILIRQDRLEDAAKALRQALLADPQSKEAHRRLGMILERLGDNTAAQSAFEAAARANPADSTAHFLLGRMLLNQGLLDAAKAELESACRLDPHGASAFYVLFQAQTRLGESEAAEKSLQTFRALKKNEKSAMDAEDVRNENEQDLRTYTAQFHAAIAVELLKGSKPMLAETHLRQALLVAPQEAQAQEILARLFLSQGRLQEARPLLVALVSQNPQDITNRLDLGTLLLQLKDPTAVTVLKGVLELDSNQPQALHNLARHYLSSGQQLPQALSLCQRLVQVQSSAANYDLLGWAFYANGHTNEALSASAQAVARDPTNSVYRQRHDRLQQIAGVHP